MEEQNDFGSGRLEMKSLCDEPKDRGDCEEQRDSASTERTRGVSSYNRSSGLIDVPLPLPAGGNDDGIE